MIDQPEKKPKSVLFDIPEDATVDLEDSAGTFASDVLEPHAIVEEEVASDSSNTSFLEKLKKKWKKEEGANVATLRGSHGSSFEGYCVVSMFGSLSQKMEAPKERYLLIKGAFLFVFKQEASPSPKYVIRLANTKTKLMHKSSSSSQSIVIMKHSRPSGNNKEWLMEHQFVFLREATAKTFCQTCNKAATEVGETEMVQQRLGHAFVLHQNKSLIRYAEKVAIDTMDFAPLRGEALSDIQVGLRLIGMQSS